MVFLHFSHAVICFFSLSYCSLPHNFIHHLYRKSSMTFVSNLDLCPELQDHNNFRMSPCECCHILHISTHTSDQHIQCMTHHLSFLLSTNETACCFSSTLPLLMASQSCYSYQIKISGPF